MLAEVHARCPGGICPLKETCERYVSGLEPPQLAVMRVWYASAPYTEEEGCEDKIEVRA